MMKKILVMALSASVFLAGCQSATVSGSGSGTGTGPRVGPMAADQFETRSEAEQKLAEQAADTRPRLDVIVPVFDPGIDPETTEVIDGVWPELRRAEAVRFAVLMKQALEETGAFGKVSVMPNAGADGHLYVMGTIMQSNGLEVGIDVTAIDASNAVWVEEEFEHEVAENHHTSVRTRDLDPYYPVFQEAAEAIVQELDNVDTAERENIGKIATMTYGNNFSPESFGGYLQQKKGLTIGGFALTESSEYELSGYPAAQDPMLRRIEAIRVRNDLFVETMQDQYQQFADSMDPSYGIWQETSQKEMLIIRERERQATIEGAKAIGLGILAIGALVLGAQSNNGSVGTAAIASSVVAAVASYSSFQESFQISDETKFHAEQLEQLGDSIDIDMGDQVVQFEEEQVELTGTASEQFEQWRDHLKRIYDVESTPDVVL